MQTMSRIWYNLLQRVYFENPYVDDYIYAKLTTGKINHYTK